MEALRKARLAKVRERLQRRAARQKAEKAERYDVVVRMPWHVARAAEQVCHESEGISLVQYLYATTRALVENSDILERMANGQRMTPTSAMLDLELLETVRENLEEAADEYVHGITMDQLLFDVMMLPRESTTLHGDRIRLGRIMFLLGWRRHRVRVPGQSKFGWIYRKREINLP